MLLKYLPIYSLLFSALFVTQVVAKDISLSSPDNALIITLSDHEGVIKYQVKYAGKEVIRPSALGLLLKNQPAFLQSLSISNSKRTSADYTWTQPWGERQHVRDHHNELYLEFNQQDNSKLNIAIRFKAFNDGFGFRYEGLGEDKRVISIIDDLTEFTFEQPEQIDAWWIPARGWNRYEYLYESTKLTKIDRVHTPVTFKLPSGEHLSIHEAALVNFASMTLDQQRPGRLKSNLTPRYDGIKVQTTANFKSSWRTVQIAKNARGLLNSDLILNLNEPNKLGDVSWVKPGKYVGIWWGMHLNVNSWGSGPKHGTTTEQTKQYMDFAAKYGFDGVLVEGWNLGWDGSWFVNGDVFSFTQSYPDFDLAEVSQYGQSLGVRLIGHHETSGSISNYEKQMDDAYSLYQKHGVNQIKTGYVADGAK